MDGIRSAYWGRGQNALLKIVTKQYLGHLMILEVVLGRGGQNALFKIAVKQCLRILMMLDFDT